MAIKTYKKTILLKGTKGDTGENENDTTVPIGGVFFYDDDLAIPTGYEETSPPTPPTPTYLYNWDFTESLTDSVQGATVNLDGAAYRDSNGVNFKDTNGSNCPRIHFGNFPMIGKTIEIDVAHFDFKGNTNDHIRFLMNNDGGSSSKGTGTLIYRARGENYWSLYGYTSYNGSSNSWGNPWSTNLDRNAFSGKTVKISYGNDYKTIKLYLDNQLIGEQNNVYFTNCDYMWIGAVHSTSRSSGDQCFDCIISGLRIYENEE